MDAEKMLNASSSLFAYSRCSGCSSISSSSFGLHGNATFDCPRAMSTGHVIVASVSLALITMATVVGNLLVMSSVFLERSLRTAANLLIVSLSAADLLVALLVMPLSAVNQVEGCWVLGPAACNVWIYFDVLCCTSSIYHLVAIAFDRFWAVSQSDYIHNRSSRRILLMIGVSWALSAVIGVPPLLGWTSPHGEDLYKTGQCLISQDAAYTVFSTVGAFYLPLVMIIVVYAKVYRKARDRILKRHFKVIAGRSAESHRCPVVAALDCGKFSVFCCCSARQQTVSDDDRTLRMESLRSEAATEAVPLSRSSLSNCRGDSRDGPPPPRSMGTLVNKLKPGGDHENNEDELPAAVLSTSRLCAQRISVCSSSANLAKFSGMTTEDEEAAVGATAETLRTSSGRSAGATSNALSPGSREKTFRRKIEQKRERKAARTLTVVTGTFVCCWLPFFVVATLRGFCREDCHFPHLVTSVILWLGYVNSLVNPMIYTLFNPDFRHAFRKILLGKYRCC